MESTPGAQSQEARELDFGASRRLEAQLAMRYLLNMMETQPYRGSRLAAGAVMAELDDPAAASAHFMFALVESLQSLGAKVEMMPVEAANDGDDGEALARLVPEVLVISGKVPGNAILNGRKATAQIIEATAEMLRVLLSTAIVAAAEDCQEGEGVTVLLREQPEFGGKINFETSAMVGIGRVRALVLSGQESRVSYLLGAAAGQAKPMSLVWEFPFVEQIYGPNRLRWNDMRSPGHDPEPKLVVAS